MHTLVDDPSRQAGQHTARLLVAEDDPNLRAVLHTMLSRAQYEVLLAEDGLDALRVFEREQVDLVLLDVVMPGLSGFDVCRRMRETSSVPIVMLTSRGHTDDVVHAFELGADDYVSKPFKREELVARVKALLRRTMVSQEYVPPPRVAVRGLVVDPARRLVSLHGRMLKLAPTEFKLLYFLASNAGHVFSRAALFRAVWGYEPVGDMNLVDVCVRRVREKLEDEPSHPKRLLTVRGAGYKLADTREAEVGK